MVCACGPTPPATAPEQDVPGITAQPAANVKATRVVVRYRTATPYRDADYLRNISQQIQAQVSYVASLSPDTHVYALQPLPGQTGTDVLKRLASLPAVLWIEPDRTASSF